MSLTHRWILRLVLVLLIAAAVWARWIGSESLPGGSTDAAHDDEKIELPSEPAPR